MSKFFKKHYKKFLIFCSLFILGFTILFAKPNKVDAMGFYSSESTYYLNGSISYVFPTSSDSFITLDLPSTTSTAFFQYYLTDGSSLQFPFFQSFTPISDTLFADGYCNISTVTDFTYGDTSFYIDNLFLVSQGVSDIIDPNFFIELDGDSIDTIFYSVSFDFISFDSSSNSFISDSYSSTGSVSSVGYFYPFQSFLLSDPLALSYYYISNIHIDFHSDSSTPLLFTLSTFCSESSSTYSFLNFIELNNFQFGLNQSEIDSIYNDGFNAGVDSVDTQQYYDNGYTHASEDFLKFENLVFSVMNGFTNTIESLLDFEIFGISVFGLIGGLVACAFGVGITILIIKAIKIFT